VTETTAFLDALAAQALPDGGWGYAPEQAGHLEPTCLALLALSAAPDRYAALLDGGRRFLGQCAVGDGRYRLERGRPEAVWPTALVLFTRSVLGDPQNELDKTASVLLGLRGRPTEGKKDDDVNDIDATLIGWPWAEGNFSWAEPTAWACLALRRLGQGEHPRVVEGLRLLLDRVLEGGGVNYGNRRIFGISLEPIPTPTALLLLSQQGRSDPRLERSVQYLIGQTASNDDLEHLAWIRLALEPYRAQPGVPAALTQLDERIRSAHAARLLNPYVRPAPLRDALTALALDVERRNPFRLPEAEVRPPLEEKETAPARRGIMERLRGFFQSFIVTASNALRPLDTPADVHIAPVGGYDADLTDVVRRQYEHFRERVPLKGKRVVLKPNLVEYHRDKVINTHPHVVAAVIELCKREEAAEVIVAEGPGHWRNVEYLVAASGLGDVLRTYKVPFVDLNHDEPVKRVNLGRMTGLQHLFLAQTIAAADVVISLPKLKTHHWAGATLSLKNLFGTLPGLCYGWPKNELHWRGIDNSIVDIALTRTPDLAIVDGVVGMEGDGPLNGTPVPTGVLIMGADLVAVDATCCRLMQLDPQQIGYLVLGSHKRLGLLPEEKIRQLGETIAGRARPFDTVDLWKHIHVGPRATEKVVAPAGA
jgi:uncharacterized protein (DUF362 family)